MLNSVSMLDLSKMQPFEDVKSLYHHKVKHHRKRHNPLLLVNKEGQVGAKDMAAQIREANVNGINKAENEGYADSVNSTKTERLAKAKAKLEAAVKKLDDAIKTLQEKQEKINSLKEKMKNTKNIFKKAGYAIAYGAAKAGLKIAEAAVKVAEGYVLGLQKIVESLSK